MESSHALSAAAGTIAAPYAIRQFTLVNNTASTIFINLGGTIPSTTSRQYVVQPYKTFTSPHINHNLISYRYLSVVIREAFIIAYDQPVSGSGQSDHDPGIGEQCPGYPFAVTTTYLWVWNNLPTIAPNAHRPINFYVATELYRGTTAFLLALRHGASPQRQRFYAGGRVGMVSYPMPDVEALQPSILVAQPFNGDGPPDTITVDAYYSDQTHCWPFDAFNQDLVSEPPASIAALGARDHVFPANPGYHRLAAYYAHTTAAGISTRFIATLDVQRDAANDYSMVAADVTQTLAVRGSAQDMALAFEQIVFVPVPTLLFFQIQNLHATATLSTILATCTRL